MSRPRTRPTRDETRTRLFVAAAEVFAARGIGAATVEQITETAGLTRGAFYSNFADKDDLLASMLDDHLERTSERNLDLLSSNPEPSTLVEALRSNLHRGDDPLHRLPLLEIELMLYVARRPELRPVLSRRLAAMRDLVGQMAARSLHDAGIRHDIDPLRLGRLLVAAEDGFRLHRILDPDSTPADAFLDGLELLYSLLVHATD